MLIALFHADIVSRSQGKHCKTPDCPMWKLVESESYRPFTISGGQFDVVSSLMYQLESPSAVVHASCN